MYSYVLILPMVLSSFLSAQNAELAPTDKKRCSTYHRALDGNHVGKIAARTTGDANSLNPRAFEMNQKNGMGVRVFDLKVRKIGDYDSHLFHFDWYHDNQKIKTQEFQLERRLYGKKYRCVLKNLEFKDLEDRNVDLLFAFFAVDEWRGARGVVSAILANNSTKIMISEKT
jgi:hypothetical protein